MTAQLNSKTRIDRSTIGIRPAASTSRFVEAGGLRLHYLDYGTAGRPTMLCLHGGAANAHWFDFVAENFSAEYHVLALDHRGHGDSQWADPPHYSYEDYAAELDAVVKKLDLRDFILIGHSMGGKTGLAYAANYPGRAATLVVIDSNMVMSKERLSEMHALGRRPRRSYATRDEFVAKFRVRPDGSTAAPELLHHLARNSCLQLEDGNWRHKYDTHVHSEHRMIDCFSCWSRIRIPSLLIKGGLSKRVTPQVCAEVKSRAPQVEFAEVQHSHHHITLDNPSGYTQTVQAFLARRP